MIQGLIGLIILLMIAIGVRLIIARRRGENFFFFSNVKIGKNAKVSNSFGLFSNIKINTDDEEEKEE